MSNPRFLQPGGGGRSTVNSSSERDFAAFPGRFGPKRTSGARKLRGVEAKGLHFLRDLQAAG